MTQFESHLHLHLLKFPWRNSRLEKKSRKRKDTIPKIRHNVLIIKKKMQKSNFTKISFENFEVLILPDRHNLDKLFSSRPAIICTILSTTKDFTSAKKDVVKGFHGTYRKIIKCCASFFPPK